MALIPISVLTVNLSHRVAARSRPVASSFDEQTSLCVAYAKSGDLDGSVAACETAITKAICNDRGIPVRVTQEKSGSIPSSSRIISITMKEPQRALESAQR